MPDDPKPEEMFRLAMSRAERLVGVNRTIAAAISEMRDAGVPIDALMRVGTKLALRARELSK